MPFDCRHPFGNPKGGLAALKQWLKSIFYTPKHTKPTDDNILRLLMPSIVGSLLCMVCLAGTHMGVVLCQRPPPAANHHGGQTMRLAAVVIR